MPCLLISPWTRGGLLCGATFDHTSVLRLLEARFGVEAPAISDWRRRTVGDLTAAFDFAAPRLDLPILPDTAAALARAEHALATLPPPVVLRAAAMPRAEPGTRRRIGA